MEPECYQLKWHSFEAHMQACVATLLHSETFADVVLSTADGRHISGHRFVLAASSAYLQVNLVVVTGRKISTFGKQKFFLKKVTEFNFEYFTCFIRIKLGFNV